MAEAHLTVEYRDALGFPGYRVGNDGSVWSRRPINGHGPLGNTWRRLTPSAQDKGREYLYFSISIGDGKQYCRTVHRLVLEAFVGPRPKGMQACHFPDRNKANNALSNLRWDTPKANQDDSAKHGTRIRGEKVGSSKLTANQVQEIRSKYRKGHRFRPGNCAELATKYGVSTVLIALIARRKAWKHV